MLRELERGEKRGGRGGERREGRGKERGEGEGRGERGGGGEGEGRERRGKERGEGERREGGGRGRGEERGEGGRERGEGREREEVFRNSLFLWSVWMSKIYIYIRKSSTLPHPVQQTVKTDRTAYQVCTSGMVELSTKTIAQRVSEPYLFPRRAPPISMNCHTLGVGIFTPLACSCKLF